MPDGVEKRRQKKAKKRKRSTKKLHRKYLRKSGGKPEKGRKMHVEGDGYDAHAKYVVNKMKEIAVAF